VEVFRIQPVAVLLAASKENFLSLAARVHDRGVTLESIKARPHLMSVGRIDYFLAVVPLLSAPSLSPFLQCLDVVLFSCSGLSNRVSVLGMPTPIVACSAALATARG
jgi:hypothetical protein